MENALTIMAVLGGLLFIFSFIKYALTGFRYHPVTGLLALIPVINLITLPTLMDGKVIRTIIIGIIGLLLSVSAWFLGADKSLHRHISVIRGQSMLSPNTEPKDLTLASSNNITSSLAQSQDTPATKHTQSIATTSVGNPQPVYLVNLPKQALYSMEFVDTPVEQLNTLKGRVVRIVTRKDSTVEGQIEKITTSSLFIIRNGSVDKVDEILISHIKKLNVLIKRNQ